MSSQPIERESISTRTLFPRSAGEAPRGAPGSAPDEAEVEAFARAVGVGLTDTPRWLPCRYLYDSRGSALFERITEQPEYYPTRLEAEILERSASVIRAITGPVTLIELGSGSAVKTDHLLAAYVAAGDPVEYVAVDVSASSLEAAREAIRRRRPGVRMTPVVGTYDDAFPLPRRHSPSMTLFLGSTIGNFNQTESASFWEKVSRHTPPGDFFLLGVDLVKDPEVLEAAYNDAAGITAEFTRNLFVRMNRELGSDLDVTQIEHVAGYNADWRRIEIFARFPREQMVHVRPLGRSHPIGAGEQIMIEISRKFVLEDMSQFVRYFGFRVRRIFTDEREWFAVLLLQKGEEDD